MSGILDELNPDDRFEIVAFDDEAKHFSGHLEPATGANLDAAQRFASKITSGGGTHILEALTEALNVLDSDGVTGETSTRPRAIIFLTDGQGSNPPEVVLAEVRKHSRDVRIYSFGVGNGVNRTFLERLARDNRGIATFIQQSSQVQAERSRLYARIATPVMMDLDLELKGMAVHSVYPRQIPDLYADGDIMVFGRYSTPGEGLVRVTGRIRGEVRTLELPVTLPAEEQEHAYIEKLWADKRVTHLLEMYQARNEDELREDITRLGIVYNLVTPFTSFLAVPESLQTEEIKEAMRRGQKGYERKLVDAMQNIRLSQRNIPPGDPVLTVLAPEDARKVVAYFPFGLVKRLRWDPIREQWNVRFLVPRGVHDGVYTIRILIVHADGTPEWSSIEYTIDGSAPEFEANVPNQVRAGQMFQMDVDPFEAVLSVEAYLPGVEEEENPFELSPETGLYVGWLEVPESLSGQMLTVRIVVRDQARNRFERDFEVAVQ